MISYEELCAALESHNAEQQAAAASVEELPAEEYAVAGDAPYTPDQDAGELDVVMAEELEPADEPVYIDDPMPEEQPVYADEGLEVMEAPGHGVEEGQATETAAPVVAATLAGPTTESAPLDLDEFGEHVQASEHEDTEKPPA